MALSKLLFYSTILCLVVDATLKLSNPEYLNGEYIAVLHKFIGPQQQFNISNTMVLAVPFDACSTLQSDVRNKFVLVDQGYCTPATKARNVQNAGGSMILIAQMFRSSLQAGSNFGDGHDIRIPTLDVQLFSKRQQIIEYLQNASLRVTITPGTKLSSTISP